MSTTPQAEGSMLLCRTAADSCVRIKCKAVQCITSIVCSPWQKVSVFSGSMAKPSSPLSHSTDKTASPSAIPPKRADAPPRLHAPVYWGRSLGVFYGWTCANSQHRRLSRLLLFAVVEGRCFTRRDGRSRA